MKSFRDNEFTQDYIELIRRSNESLNNVSDSFIIKKAIRDLALSEALNYDHKIKDLPEDMKYYNLWYNIREEEIRKYLG